MTTTSGERVHHERQPAARVSVSKEEDPQEREAATMADAALRMPDPGPALAGARHTAVGSASAIQRSPTRQPSAPPVARAADPVASRMTRGDGRPLPADVRSFFAPRLGADLSAVRVHADGQAAALAHAFGARAFTVGRDIFFAHGEYQPRTATGQRLLAHELAHTLQQSTAVLRQPTPRGSTRTVTFGREEGSVVARLTRDEPDEELDDIHDDIGRELGFFHDHWRDGLENFITTMQFSSAQEAAANYVGALGKSVAKSLLDNAIDAVGLIPVIGSVAKPLLKATVDAGVALYDERERSAAASADVQLRDYIVQLRTIIGESKVEVDRRHAETFPTLLAALRSASATSPRATTAEGQPAWVHDDAARVILRYRGALAALRSRIPPARIFQQRLTEEFARTGRNVGYVTRGTWRPSGTLTIDVEVKRERSNGRWQWDVTDIDDHWTLGTSAPRPERIAASLMSSLGGRPILTHLSVPKSINLEIETEVPGFNEVTEGSISITPGGAVFVRTRRGDPLLMRESATNPDIALRILQVSKIEGSSD